MASTYSSSCYETLFQSSSFNLIVPEISSLPDEPTENVSEDSHARWWNQIQESNTRDVAFFDEKLFYFLSMHLSDEALRDVPGSPALHAEQPTSEMLRFLGRLQLTMTASFIPSLPSSNPFLKSTQTPTSSMPISTSSSSLAPPPHSGFPPHTPRSGISNEHGDSSVPPVTPNPFPMMNQGEEQYANIEGVVVWEGGVEEVSGPWEDDKLKTNTRGSGSGRKIIKVKGGWEIVWRGEVPIAYVRTQIQNPLLALTASVTLRDQAHNKTHRRNAQSIDALSIRSGTTIRTDGTDYEAYEDDDGDGYAGMDEIDLLGGLTGGEDILPATRLAPSIRDDLSIPSAPLNSPLPLSAITPATAPTITTPSTSSTASGPSRERGITPNTVQPIITTTLRKSYRRVLSLAPGLRVRMRTLFLPQLLTGEIDEEEGEKCITLCVEIENSTESNLNNGFEVNSVKVEVGGKGGKATTQLISQSQSKSTKKSIEFPLRLGSIEQYNLLYKVLIASSSIHNNENNGISGGGKDGNLNGIEEIVNKSLGRNDEIRPVSISVIGKPFSRNNEDNSKYKYQTREFHSRWNCSLDLTSFYSSGQNHVPNISTILPKHKNRNSRPISNANNNTQNSAIAGDKRYSLAHLLSVEKERELHQQNQNQQNRKPLMPSQMINTQHPGGRVTSLTRPLNHTQKEENGLLVSVKLLPQTSSNTTSNVINGQNHPSMLQPLETFSLEIFVHNRSEEVRRFRLIIPHRNESTTENRIKEIWDKRKKKKDDEPNWGVDDIVLKRSLSNHLSNSPSIIPLENDIRCGPLLPFTSLSARIRFLALKKGLHKIDNLRIVGMDNEFDLTISPVLDIVVGSDE